MYYWTLHKMTKLFIVSKSQKGEVLVGFTLLLLFRFVKKLPSSKDSMKIRLCDLCWFYATRWYYFATMATIVNELPSIKSTYVGQDTKKVLLLEWQSKKNDFERLTSHNASGSFFGESSDSKRKANLSKIIWIFAPKMTNEFSFENYFVQDLHRSGFFFSQG